MKDFSGGEKVKVFLVQFLFSNLDIFLFDELINDFDVEIVIWLADFLVDFKNMVIVVFYDCYFLDMVCMYVVDIDFKCIKIFIGNYIFWYEFSLFMVQQMANKNKKIEQKCKEMQEFIQCFSVNVLKFK